MMLLKSVRNCDRTPLLLTQQQPTNTTAENGGGRRKNPKLAIFGGRERERGAKKEGGREGVDMGRLSVDRDEVEGDGGGEGGKRSGGEPPSLSPSHEPWQSGVKAAE